MAIDLRPHHYEGSVFMSKPKLLSPQQRQQQKIQLWNRFVDSGLIGVTEEDCGIVPRVLPLSYFKEIQKAAYLISLFSLRLLSLAPREIKAIVPGGPIRDFLINELEVLRYRPQRLIGSFRFDMALVGPPEKGNPPKLLEINEIGFGGLSRTTFIQKTMLELLPSIAKSNLILDPADAEIRNFHRLGDQFVRFQYDAYDWEEEVLLREAHKRGVRFSLISPEQLQFEYDLIDYPMLQQKKIRFQRGKLQVGSGWHPDFVQMGYSFELQDYLRAPKMYQEIVRGKTPQYSPFVTGLVASKAILVLLDDKTLRRKLLGGDNKTLEAAILGARMLTDEYDSVKAQPKQYVLKHVDGLGGEKVFFDKELARQLSLIPKAQQKEWIVQERVRLNAIELEGTLSKKRKVIADLGVFVQYDWSKGKFNHFEVGGFITRATNKKYKVNVSEGGIQVPVIFDKAS